MKERKQSKILGLMLAFYMVLTMTISGLGALPISAAEGDDTVSFYVGGVQLASYNTPISDWKTRSRLKSASAAIRECR